MSLVVKSDGLSTYQTNVTATTDETATFSTSVTAGTTPNYNATYTTLIATTTYASYGIMVQGAGLQTSASANQRCMVNIAIGGAGAETVIVPNLTFGNTADYGAAAGQGNCYFFPIYIPSGVRISATAAASTSADIVNVAVRLLQNSCGPGKWYGSRVTSYGDGMTASPIRISGTLHTPGQNSYSTATVLSSSTANAIRYMQIGYDLSTDTTGSSSVYLARIMNGASDVIVTHLPIKESTTIEAVQFSDANFILSHMMFDTPKGISLQVSAMRTTVTPEARGFVVYGVD